MHKRGIIDHIGRYRDNRMNYNPKVTVEYFMAASMRIHEGYCKSINPDDKLCKTFPTDKVVIPEGFNRG
jgi:hypothetical protein